MCIGPGKEALTGSAQAALDVDFWVHAAADRQRVTASSEQIAHLTFCLLGRIIVKLMIGIALLAATAQTASAPDLDAVIAAPGNLRIVLENEEVRVLQVDVRPGETESIHEHRWPGVLHIQSAQPAIDISYEWRDGKMVEINRRQLPAGSPPAAIWVPRQGAHAVQNLGTAPFRLLRVELKGQSNAAFNNDLPPAWRLRRLPWRIGMKGRPRLGSDVVDTNGR